MGIRCYDPITARFVTRDPMLGINDYAYCGNNPVGRVDADGQAVETIADIASIGWSTYDLIKNPSWANVGYLAWDVGATVVPFVPGSYTSKGAKIAAKGAKVAKRQVRATSPLGHSRRPIQTKRGMCGITSWSSAWSNAWNDGSEKDETRKSRRCKTG